MAAAPPAQMTDSSTSLAVRPATAAVTAARVAGAPSAQLTDAACCG
jgi:hypothetical protein